MKIELSSGFTLESTSASKKMQANAQILLGKTGVKILTALEVFSKEKMLVTTGLNGVLSFLKTSDNMTVEKVAGSAAGKKLAVSLKALAKAKTIVAISGALKKVKPISAMQPRGHKPVRPSGVQKARNVSRKPVPSGKKVYVQATENGQDLIFALNNEASAKYMQKMWPKSVSNEDKVYIINPTDFDIRRLQSDEVLTKEDLIDFEFGDSDMELEDLLEMGVTAIKKSVINNANVVYAVAKDVSEYDHIFILDSKISFNYMKNKWHQLAGPAFEHGVPALVKANEYTKEIKEFSDDLLLTRSRLAYHMKQSKSSQFSIFEDSIDA